MAKNLVIVESPAKAKTIQNYLGKDFIVMSSYGHVRDLAKKGMAIDIENNFNPQYEISTDKKAIIAALKKEVKAVDTIWLATDEDREGEAISWHLYETLNLSNKNTKRITFNEITKSAVQKAIEKPREIDKKLVDAQQARRVLDRLVGFELSPVLWKKVKPSLSAGRVQSVAVRLIVEREREIINFQPNNYFKVTGNFSDKEKKITAALSRNLEHKKEVEEFLTECSELSFEISEVSKKPAVKYPSPPFTTSTLQQEASLKLGFGVTRTMRVAQALYEAGYITYMRTDSVNLSDTAIQNAKNSIIGNFGIKYSNAKHYKNQNKGAQEAHEAIRPTDFEVSSINAGRDENRLYDLIWKRAIASQMSPAKLERTTIKIGNPEISDVFNAKGEVIKFDGFLKVYIASQIEEADEEDNKTLENILPDLKVGTQLNTDSIIARERYTKALPRYVEASLVKKLEDLGIGRPSTYAPTISTIQKRGYVEKLEREGIERKYQIYTLYDKKIKKEEATEIIGKEKNKLSPTDIGIVVTDFLTDNFGKILDYNFTAKVEQEFDEIAQGMEEWTEMIKRFYDPFHKTVQNTLEHSDHVSGERYLGEDPKTKEKIIARIGRFGPIIQIGDTSNKEQKVRYAPLRPNQSIETITPEEALELFKLPRELGLFEDKIIKTNIGRFGPYIQHNNKFVSLKEDDPMEITLEKAIQLIKEKREEDKNKIIKSFSENKETFLLNGRWGPYLKIGKKNYKLPKGTEVENLSYEQCLEIAENQPDKKDAKRKTAASKPKASKKKTK